MLTYFVRVFIHNVPRPIHESNLKILGPEQKLFARPLVYSSFWWCIYGTMLPYICSYRVSSRLRSHSTKKNFRNMALKPNLKSQFVNKILKAHLFSRVNARSTEFQTIYMSNLVDLENSWVNFNYLWVDSRSTVFVVLF